MASPDTPSPAGAELPDAQVKTRSGLSIVWLVPVVALAIGGWLAYKAISEKGPTVTIEFASGEGMEAAKTKIKFKDVEVGVVEEINLRPDLSGVTVVAQMKPGTKQFLTSSTRFWVVRAHVSAGKVSGLGTLLGGAYIGLDPERGGTPQTHFTGLDAPPPLPADEPGRYFTLRAKSIGSLDVGAPVYYRKIKVGQVVSYALDDQDDSLVIRIFVHAPHDARVRTNTRFWNASGVDVTVDSEGLKIDTESLISILSGGIAFDLPAGEDKAEVAEVDREFPLFADRHSAHERVYALRHRFLMYFTDGSVRGLVPGSEVLFRGIKIGEVVRVGLQYDWGAHTFRVPVAIDLEPGRIEVVGNPDLASVNYVENMGRLVERGLRAQLGSGNLLTGKLVVGLDFHPKEPAAELTLEDGVPVLPTIPAKLEELTANVAQILDRFSKIPFETIGSDVQAAAHTLNQTLDEAKQLVATLRTDVADRVGDILRRIETVPIEGIGEDLHTTIRTANTDLVEIRKLLEGVERDLMPEINTTLKDARSAVAGVESSLGERSALQLELRRSLAEIADAARAVGDLADYMERHPESLLKGKEE